MRSTDGLRPKIGRVIESGKPLGAQARGGSAQIGSPAAEAPLPQAVTETRAKGVLRSANIETTYGLGSGIKHKSERQGEVEIDTENDIDWDKVASIGKFLILPALFAIVIIVLGVKLPRVALYGIAAIIGVAAMIRAQKDPEILLALMIIYIPFAHLYAISLAPLVNGTNIFILLCLFSGITAASRRRESAFKYRPGFNLTVAWFLFSSLSILTLLRTPGALSYTLSEELSQYTGWLSQFGFYLAVYSLVSNRGQAKRAMIYIMFGTIIVVMHGVSEAIDKVGLNSIEKQRLGGVFEQPNDLGGFIAYTFIPFIALFIFNMGKMKAWLLTPYFLITLKILITTFSRGAYVAFAIGGFFVVWMRGKAFMFGWGFCALILVALFPQVLPNSVLDRINQTSRDSKVERLDKSSEHRFVMWDAAIDMTLENPITGKGFKAFPFLKAQYTRIPVEESDPHSMYFYISSQMGIPTLLLYLGLMAHLVWMGLMIFKRSHDGFERVIGASMFAIVPCLGLINVFGSRMVGMSFVGYFYAMVVIVQMLYVPYKNTKTSTRLGAADVKELELASTQSAVARKKGLGKAVTIRNINEIEEEALEVELVEVEKPVPRIGRSQDS